eukprot:1587679-Rhodomonas_salina.1
MKKSRRKKINEEEKKKKRSDGDDEEGGAQAQHADEEHARKRKRRHRSKLKAMRGARAMRSRGEQHRSSPAAQHTRDTKHTNRSSKEGGRRGGLGRTCMRVQRRMTTKEKRKSTTPKSSLPCPT